MKILYVNSLFPSAGDRRAFGGAETFSLRLVGGLLEAGHSISIVRSGTDAAGGVEQLPNGITVHSMPLRNVYPFFDSRPHAAPSRLAWHWLEDRGRISPAFDRIVADVQPDLLHSNNVAGLTTDLWRAASAARVPILHTLHDYYLTCPKVLRFARGGPCAQTCTSCSILSRRRRQATRLVDQVIGVSERMLNIHRDEGLFVDTPSEVILNFPPAQRSRAAAPHQLGSRPVFGYIGRQATEKGIFELLTAFATLPPGAAKLVVAGTIVAPVQQWVMKNVPRPDDVVFTGFTTQEAFYPQIDVAVIPSLWEEPCSMGAGEAFSYGIPALGSRRGGIPEMLDGGRLGWLYEPGTGELPALLARLVADPAEISLKAASLRDHQVDDATDRLVASYLGAYDRLLARKGVASAA